MGKRAFSSVFYVLFIFLGTSSYGYSLIQKVFPNLDSRYILLGFIAIVLALCCYELVQLMKIESIFYKVLTFAVCFLPLYFFGSLILISPFAFIFNLRNLLFVVPFLVALLTLFRFSDELHSYDSSKLIFVVCYIGIPFGLSVLIPNFNSVNPSDLFFIFVLIWLSDTAAYLVGRQIGKTPFFPKISPNKTREGFFAGFIATIITGIIIENYVPYLRGNWIIISIIVAIFAPLGDLAESKLKRSFHVKDSSNLIPGHGGFLDRLDSFIGCIPFVYLYFLIANI